MQSDTLKREKKKKKEKKKKHLSIILKKDGSIQAGTIDAIVEHLLENVELEEVKKDENESPPVRILDHEKDIDLQVFIISYRQFVSPTRFFLILEERFNASKELNTRLSVLRMLSVWLDKYLDRDFFFHDKGNRLFDQLLKFIIHLGECGHQQQANELKLLILRVKRRRKELLLSVLNYHHDATSNNITSTTSQETVPFLSLESPSTADSTKNNTDKTMSRSTSKSEITPSPPLTPTSLSASILGTTTIITANEGPLATDHAKKFSLCEMSLVELAEQLTLIECNMFRAIREREFLNLNWKRDEQKRHSRHIVKMVERFNKVSYWVATRIVREPDLKRRTSLLKRFIILAEKCADLHNYNTLMEVLAGLNLHPVQRLKATWRVCFDLIIN